MNTELFIFPETGVIVDKWLLICFSIREQCGEDSATSAVLGVREFAAAVLPPGRWRAQLRQALLPRCAAHPQAYPTLHQLWVVFLFTATASTWFPDLLFQVVHFLNRFLFINKARGF